VAVPGAIQPPLPLQHSGVDGGRSARPRSVSASARCASAIMGVW